MRIVRRLLPLLIIANASLAATAQLVKQIPPARTHCCLLFRIQALLPTLSDWNQLSRYAAQDRRLEASPAPRGRVVFLGDSITQIWKLRQSFPGKPYVNRGISGQTTAQMLARMFPDVIDLKPAAMILLGGTNDIAGNTGPETMTTIEENIEAMTELAKLHHIRVVLCTLTPVSDALGHKETQHRPPAQILALNRWIRGYAKATHAQLADYYPAVVNAQGFFRRALTREGLHPNAAGFSRMAPVAEAAIERALRNNRND